MTTETVTELTEDQLTALDLQDRLRAMSFDVIPATIVCGMAGISGRRVSGTAQAFEAQLHPLRAEDDSSGPGGRRAEGVLSRRVE